MFVRKKKNPSGVISIQVIDKSHGKYRVIKTIGSSSDANRIDDLYAQGKQWLAEHLGDRDLFLQAAKEQVEKQVIEEFLSRIDSILLNGTQLNRTQVFRYIR